MKLQHTVELEFSFHESEDVYLSAEAEFFVSSDMADVELMRFVSVREVKYLEVGGKLKPVYTPDQEIGFALYSLLWAGIRDIWPEVEKTVRELARVEAKTEPS